MKAGSKALLFLKAQASSLAASILDFSLYGLLFYGFGTWYLAATVAGLLAGGILNFFLNRSWAFRVGKQGAARQALRYVLVWNGNFLLNAAGVYLVKETLHADPTISKVAVSLLVGITYNFLLQKNFVFRQVS